MLSLVFCGTVWQIVSLRDSLRDVVKRSLNWSVKRNLSWEACSTCVTLAKPEIVRSDVVEQCIAGKTAMILL